MTETKTSRAVIYQVFERECMIDYGTAPIPETHVAAFFDEKEAEACKGTNVLRSVKSVPVFTNVQEYRDYETEQIRKRALSRLTKEEREALGL